MSCQFLFHGIFLTQESNPCLTSSALAGGFFTTSTTWEALIVFWVKLYSPKMEAETLTSSSGKSDHVREIQSLQIWLVKMRLYLIRVRWGEVAQLCPTLCDPVDCNLLGFSVHGILQARILEWIAISFARGSSRPRDRTQVSRIGGRRFNLWATREGWFIHLLEQNTDKNCHLTIDRA